MAQLLAGKVVVSVAAGWTLERYRQILPENAHCICTVPNTPVAVGEGIFVCEQSHSLSEQEFAQFEQLFSPIALIEMIDTNHLSAAARSAAAPRPSPPCTWRRWATQASSTA